MTWITSRVVYSLIFFSVISALIIVFKPPFMYDEEGNPKPFGIGPYKTPFSLGSALLLVAIASSFLFSVISMISNCSHATRRERKNAISHMYGYVTPNVMPSDTYVPSAPPSIPYPNTTHLPPLTRIVPSVPSSSSPLPFIPQMQPHTQQLQALPSYSP